MLDEILYSLHLKCLHMFLFRSCFKSYVSVILFNCTIVDMAVSVIESLGTSTLF